MRTLCNPEIFRTLLYLEPEENSEYSKSVEYSLHRTHNSLYPCQLRTRDIFRTLSNIYNGPFCSEPYVTLTYLEPCHIMEPEEDSEFCQASINSIFQESYLTLAYLESWYIQNLRNIQNPVKHLRCNVFFNEP